MGMRFFTLVVFAAAVGSIMLTRSVRISMIKNYMPSFPPALQQRLEETPSAKEDNNITVESLMYKYKSDKSRDDHGYTKLYNMLFSTMRNSVTNMTEVGIAAGQSIQAWYRFFPNAEIHAFDKMWHADEVKANMDALKPRVHSHITNILDENIVGSMADLGFIPESMDIIIEDGPHMRLPNRDF